MAREINLVPDVKDEMIGALKLRNFIFFLCIVISAASIGVTVMFGLIAGGQQLAISGKKDTINKLSEKIGSYSDLSEFLTIKDQLNNIDKLTNNKKVMSRTFNILLALIPKEGDSITISEMTIDFTEGAPKYLIFAQADALREPFIDYNVLDSFKKSMDYMRYDYGTYVDKEGNNIPSYCMIEYGNDGAMFTYGEKDIYAYWAIEGDGCKISDVAGTSDSDNKSSGTNGYIVEEYDGKKVIKIWRTPQYAQWYKQNPAENEPYIDLDGHIHNVEHFESACITYKGDISQNAMVPKWNDENNCYLVQDGVDGIQINDSANGRNSSDSLVLSFSATITLDPAVYKFTNTHMRAIPPSGRYNVTDSYSQVQNMFSERARACDANDETCKANVENSGADQTQNNDKTTDNQNESKNTEETNTNGGQQ